MMALVSLMNQKMQTLQMAFGSRLRNDVPLARYTSARVGGAAEALIIVESVAQLIDAVKQLWSMPLQFVVLGGGSNVLVSDAGYQGVVILNRSRQIRFEINHEPPTVWAASGANLGLVARQAAAHSLSGLEWAAGIPGTIGGAVVGNAGALGEDTSGNLLMAEILHRKVLVSDKSSGPRYADEIIREYWPVERLEYSYRNSLLKHLQKLEFAGSANGFSNFPSQPLAVVLAATLRLSRSMQELIQKKMEQNTLSRRKTQPPGASMGSMFKNPAGDFAGRLIEEAGLKGIRVGDAEISPKHANFFINRGQATAKDIYELIKLVRRTVAEKFAVELELEIELVGEWNEVS